MALLVGPLISPTQRRVCRGFFHSKEPKKVLEVIEFELSLLYEVLHTKLPVVNCKIGYIFRMICMGFTSGALVSFTLITKAKQYHDDLENSEVWVTYSLLIGAITLDFISIGLLRSSDCYFLTHKDSLPELENDTIMDWIHHRVINRRMWSKRIPQLNFITYCVKTSPVWLKYKLAKRLPIRFILEFIEGFRSMSSQVFEVQVLWKFIFEQVKGKAEPAKTVEKGKEICQKRGDGILHSHENLIWSVRDLDPVGSLLTWHVATELCFQVEDHRSTSSSENPDYRGISKLLSDYMFYLLHEQTVLSSKLDWKMKFEHTYQDMQTTYLRRGERDVCKRMISAEPSELWYRYRDRAGLDIEKEYILYAAFKLFRDLKESDQGIPWELISKVWVELMCYTAINCRPNVHAQQPSMGGQLITIVWLLMNHFGLGTQFEADKGHSNVSGGSVSCFVGGDCVLDYFYEDRGRDNW